NLHESNGFFSQFPNSLGNESKHFLIGLHVEAFPYLSTCTKSISYFFAYNIKNMHCAHITRNTIVIKTIVDHRNEERGENKAAQEAHEWKAQGTGANEWKAQGTGANVELNLEWKAQGIGANCYFIEGMEISFPEWKAQGTGANEWKAQGTGANCYFIEGMEISFPEWKAQGTGANFITGSGWC
ncbi:hypothetical protein ACJX0J_028702, partial [Zea mays]